jgi:hypothetical protein
MFVDWHIHNGLWMREYVVRNKICKTRTNYTEIQTNVQTMGTYRLVHASDINKLCSLRQAESS